MITDGPLPSLPSRLTTVNGNILPPKYLAEKGDEFFGKNPVGTGRFKFKQWVKDDHLTLEANPDYWGEKARIQSLIFKPVPESATRLSMLKAGQADIITNLSPDQADAFKNDPNAAAVAVPSGLMIQAQIDTLTPGPLQDRRVRQAINYAVDKEAIVKNILRGYGKVAAVNIAPEYYGYNPNLKPYPYDPEKARALLKEAGVDPGFSLTMATPTGRYLADKLVTEAVADYLTKAGLKTSVVVMEWGDYLAKRGTGRGPLALNGWAASNTFQTELTLVPLYKTGDPNSVYKNPEFDRVVDQAVRTLDEAKRIELLHQAQQMIYDDAARLFLYQQYSIFGISKRTDFQPRPDDQLYVGTSAVK